MDFIVRPISTKEDFGAWDRYVESHPESNLYHLSGWKRVAEKAYSHKTHYLMALKDGDSGPATGRKLVGILPLVHLKNFIFGNHLISIPFMDLGGILADDENVERMLISAALNLARNLKATQIELRHTKPIEWLSDGSNPTVSHDTKATKVRMLLDLPGSSKVLMKSFKSKLRSQIKRPLEEGLTTRTGGINLLEDFYSVFCVNMRDLGSPVHSKKMIGSVLEEFPERARILVVYKGKRALACGLVLGFQDTLENPWASSLRTYSRLSPNMLLYWTMLAYACDNGYRKFDFGRSTPEESTYRFKRQWGAEPQCLHWHVLKLDGNRDIDSDKTDKTKFDKAIRYWRKLPVPVSRFIGPMIRKHIAL